MELDCNNTHLVGFLRMQRALKLPAGEYSFIYDYPLRTPAVMKHALTEFSTELMILSLAARDYEVIYRTEDQAKTEQHHLLLNRGASNGPYGIYGHDISDLFFEGIDIDVEKRLITFTMGS